MVTIIATSECRMILPHAIEDVLDYFDKAAQAYGCLGGGDPEDYKKIQDDYLNSKATLRQLLGLK